MAKIGLNNFKFGVLTEADGGVVSYGAMQSLGKAVDANVSITNNSAVLYADDVIAESDNTFSTGTITLTIDDADDTVFAVLLGHEIDSSTQEMIRNANALCRCRSYHKQAERRRKILQSRISVKGQVC